MNHIPLKDDDYISYRRTEDNHLEVVHQGKAEFFKLDEIGVVGAAIHCALITEVYGGRNARSATRGVKRFMKLFGDEL